MSELFNYLIQGSISLVLLYGFYLLLLRTTTFHQLNRACLVLIILASCTGYFIPQEVIHSLQPTTERFLFPEDAEWVGSSLAVSSKPIQASAGHSLSQILLGVYLAGVGLIGLRFLATISRILWIRARAIPYPSSERNVYLSTHPEAPFSFFNWIFMPLKQKDVQAWEIMLAHEQAHSAQWHSLDRLLLEVAAIIFWFHPSLYALKRTLTRTHEHLADQAVLSKGYALPQYLELLVQHSFGKTGTPLLHNFSSSILKHRILMMTKTKTTPLFKLAYLVFLPGTMALLMAFSWAPSVEEAVMPTPSLLDAPTAIPDISPIEQELIERVSSEYGQRRNPWTKKLQMHHGIDFVAPMGTPIRATSGGIVVKRAYKGKGIGYGRHIVIQHDDTYSTLYSQLSAFKVEQGQEVKKGEAIGLLGSSGKSTGPHLHYEVWKEGNRVDPAPYLP